MKHVVGIVCNHLCALGPRFFSCSTSMLSMHAALLFSSAAIPFLYSSSLNADTNDGFPSIVGSAGHLGFVGIVPWPLTSRWCATWLELTRHGGVSTIRHINITQLSGPTSAVSCGGTVISAKRSENWSHPISSIGLGRHKTIFIVKKLINIVFK